jgi:RNA polymerase sigma factor (sigma-70 family)
VSKPPSEPKMLFLESETSSLFNRYGRAIFAYVRLHALSYEECKDITLEVFQIAWTHDDLSAIQETEHLKWLRRVASYKVADRYRRASRHPEISLDAVTQLVPDVQSTDPESIALQREACLRLHQTIQRLPILHQQILRLRYGDGLSFAEIGQLLNKTEAAVRKQHARVLARLRALYDQ